MLSEHGASEVSGETGRGHPLRVKQEKSTHYVLQYSFSPFPGVSPCQAECRAQGCNSGLR